MTQKVLEHVRLEPFTLKMIHMANFMSVLLERIGLLIRHLYNVEKL
jgi:hypothetical protein